MADVDLKKIESALSTIEQQATSINSNIEDSKPGFDAGMQKLVSKLDALDSLRSWANTNSGRNGGKVDITGVEGKLQTLISLQTSIDTNTNTLASNSGKISNKVEEATDYLKSLKEHIVDGGKKIPASAANAGNAKNYGSGSLDGISRTVDDIRDILTQIRDNTISNTSGDEKDELNKLMKENALTREKEQKEKNDYLAAIRKKKKDRSPEEKQRIKDYEEKERNQKKHEEKKGKKGTGFVKAVGALTSLISEKPSVSKVADKGISAVSQASPVVGSILSLVKAMVELGSKQDRATSEFARAIGGGRFGKVNAGESVRGMVRGMPARRGYTADAAYSAMTEVAEARGRTTDRMTAGAIQSAIDLKRFGVGAEAVNSFDTFGKSLEQTDRFFAKLYGEVSKKGLSFKNVSKAVNDNLKMAQSHTFANGLRGLTSMAEKSTQLKYNMQQVFNFADKVSELEGAISTSANLSVLGGQFAQFSNPMQLLYEGLNDTEALNDRMVKMFANRASWNSRTGQIDMTALDREFVKQAAKAAGLDANEMLSMSLNEGKMRHIGRQIHGVDKDTAEYIKNIAEIDEKGRAFVNLNGRQTDVSNLTMEDKEALEKESRAKDVREGAKLGDIYENTMSIGETLDNLLSYLQEQLGRWVFGLFNRFAAKENNRQTISQGEGSKELQDKRLNYYNMNASAYKRTDLGAFFTKGDKHRINRKDFAEMVANMTDEELDRLLAKDAEGQSPNGITPSFRMPGSGMITGPSHFHGGVKGLNRGKVWEAEGGEFLINKQSSARYRNELLKIQNGTYNPYAQSNSLIKNDMAKHYNPMEVSAFTREIAKNMAKQAQQNSVNGTIKVDIPQTITINLAGGGKIGDYDIRAIVMKYVDSFMKEAQMRKDFSGFNKEKFYNQSGVI